MALAIGLTSITAVRAEQTYALRAAFVLNFLKFTDWPDSAASAANAPLIVATIGDTALTASLKKVLTGETVQGRKLEVQAFRDAAEWKATDKPCHALFVDSTSQSAAAEILTALAGRPVLTMSESSGFCKAGGMLNLYEDANRVRFEANPESAEKEGLKLRSGLLRLATIVKTARGSQ